MPARIKTLNQTAEAESGFRQRQFSQLYHVRALVIFVVSWDEIFEFEG
jgi:hypothetical protein